MPILFGFRNATQELRLAIAAATGNAIGMGNGGNH
jgi:hypothetical protein